MKLRHAAALALVGRTLRMTPAMAVGVTDRLWSLEDIVRTVDEWEASQKTENHEELR